MKDKDSRKKTSSGYKMGTEWLQEKAGTVKENLNGHKRRDLKDMHSTPGKSEKTGDRQSRVVSVYGPMHLLKCWLEYGLL